jgi:hypothetical protein
MKRVLACIFLMAVLLFPGIVREDCHHTFDCIQDQVRFWDIQLYHGPCAVATDFSHFIRASNGEICRLKQCPKFKEQGARIKG